MDMTRFYATEGEKPLENLVDDGGFCGIFRTIGCIGDSLSSGELESKDDEGIKGYHDFYEYSWGQYMARTIGNKVYNFSKGGMYAKAFFDQYAEKYGVYEYDKLCQCYIIALGINDLNRKSAIGNMDNISVTQPKDPADESIMSYYAAIVRNIKSMQPDAKFFFVTTPYDETRPEDYIKREDELAEAIRKLADKTTNAYTIDLRKYAPTFDKKFKDTFFCGHMTPAGYMIFAKMIMSYIDYIIRSNPADFAQVGFIGTPYKYRKD